MSFLFDCCLAIMMLMLMRKPCRRSSRCDNTFLTIKSLVLYKNYNIHNMLIIALFGLLALFVMDEVQKKRECRLTSTAEEINHQVRVQQYNRLQKYPQRTLQSWMERLNNQTLVSQLSIPGTHDSGAFRCDYQMPCSIYQCQSLNFYQQLTNGIRHLDLRVNSYQPLTIGHSSVQFITFKEVLLDIRIFLDENPSQFLILAFQRNSGQYDPAEEIINDMLKEGIKTIFSQKPPTVGELRGKVWIVSGIGINFQPKTSVLEGNLGFTDSPSIYLQNFWRVNIDTIELKTQNVLRTAFSIKCESQRLKANFLSGSLGFSPFDLAIHTKGPNKQLLLELSKGRRHCLGISIMDFPSPALIEAIIETNFGVE